MRVSAGRSPWVATSRSPPAAVDLEAHEADPERGGHSAGDRCELLGPLVGGLEGGGEAGDGVVGVAALAEHQPSYAAAEPLPERAVEQRREQQHDEHHLALVEGVAEQQGEPGEQGEVDGDEDDRQRAGAPGCGRAGRRSRRAAGGRRDGHRDRAASPRPAKRDDVARARRARRAADRARRQRHHQHAPEQPAHPVALEAVGPAVADDDGRHRRRAAPSTVRRPRAGEPARSTTASGPARGRVEVDAGRQVASRAVRGRRDDDQHGRAATITARADPAGDAPRPGRKRPVGEDQQQPAMVTGRNAVNRSRNHSAKVMPASASSVEAEPDVGLGEPVEGPEQAEARRAPAEPVAAGRTAARQAPREPQARRWRRTVQPGSGVPRRRPARRRVGRVDQRHGETTAATGEQTGAAGAARAALAGTCVRPTRPLGGRADRLGSHGAHWTRKALSPTRNPSADDQQPQRTGQAGHVLQRRDAEQQGQAAEDQADRPSQRGTPPARAVANRAMPDSPARPQHHGMVPIQWL